MSLEEFRARLAAEVCKCSHTRAQHVFNHECGVDEDGYPCLCVWFTRQGWDR